MTSRLSDHNPDHLGIVRARDFTDDPAGGLDCLWLRETLRRNRDQRIKYVISEGQMFSAYPTSAHEAWTWRPYSGVNGHFQHLHLSVVSDSRADLDNAWNLHTVLGSPIPRLPTVAPDKETDDMDAAELISILRSEGVSGAGDLNRLTTHLEPHARKWVNEETTKVSVTQGYAGAGDIGRITTALAPLLSGGGDVTAAARALTESLPAAVVAELANRLKES